MRLANNFHPEWGYLAPVPGVMRTVRIALVAAAVGATAGGAVVLSLVGPPAEEDASVAARTLAPNAERTAAAPAPAPRPALMQAAAHTEPQVAAPAAVRPNGHVGAPGPETHAASPPQTATALAEAPAISAATQAPPPASAANDSAVASAAKKIARKPAVAWRSAPREPGYAYYGDQPLEIHGGVMRAPLAQLPAGAYPVRSDF